MSFDVYLASFKDRSASGIPRSSIMDAFGDLVRWKDERSGETRYSGTNDGCWIGLSAAQDDASLITFISINRPVGQQQFWDALYQIMRLGNVALFFPGCDGVLIASASVTAHLPPELVEWGTPRLIGGGREIIEDMRSP